VSDIKISAVVPELVFLPPCPSFFTDGLENIVQSRNQENPEKCGYARAGNGFWLAAIIRPRAEMLWGWFCSKLRGHIQYYGVSYNSKGVNQFRVQAIQIMFKWLNRRSQRKSFNW
jgi:hypothetical protein